MSATSMSKTGSKAAQNAVIRALLGTKVGMTQVWEANGQIVPVTVIQAGPCVVTQIRTPATDGYSAIQVAYGAIDPRKTTKPQAGHFAKAGVTPRRHVAEIRTGDAAEHTLGQELTVDVFEAGQIVDVVGTSRGKGFAGGMKRHGFHGLGASHGTHKKHRSPGAIGACATPARVFKGQKMAGRMGGDTVTTQNLTVHAIDTERGLLLIKGAVPGATGGLVTVHTAAKRGYVSSRAPSAVSTGGDEA